MISHVGSRTRGWGRWPLLVWLGGILAWAGACSSSDASGEEAVDVEGLALCCELGDICHPGADDPIGGVVRGCHDLGHQNDPVVCRDRYAACMEACQVGREYQGDGAHACR